MDGVFSIKQAKAEKCGAEFATRKVEEVRKATETQAVTLTTRKARTIEEGFGPDYNAEHAVKQPILDYQQVGEQFGIKISGFGKGSNKTPSTAVLISPVDKRKSEFVYHDCWINGGDYIYSGEGKNGDQTMSVGNRAVMYAAKEGKVIYLFVKFSPREYYYQGIFELVNYIYEDDLDENGSTRKEYKFRLRKRN